MEKVFDIPVDVLAHFSQELGHLVGVVVYIVEEGQRVRCAIGRGPGRARSGCVAVPRDDRWHGRELLGRLSRRHCWRVGSQDL